MSDTTKIEVRQRRRAAQVMEYPEWRDFKSGLWRAQVWGDGKIQHFGTYTVIPSADRFALFHTKEPNDPHLIGEFGSAEDAKRAGTADWLADAMADQWGDEA